MLEPGTLVDGKYRILRKVGEGGMSTVYMALNERANKTWAIKEIRTDGGVSGAAAAKSLMAETEMLKKLKHPRLPAIADVIDGDGFFLVVMDYIEGRPLDQVLFENGTAREEQVIEWGIQLCGVLGYLHSRNPPVIYRDMKPSNVMLRPDGEVSLLDFGTAREFRDDVCEDTVYLGTRGYAAPEQYGGSGQTDARTDIYCLGVTMYHLLTGHNPCMPPYKIYPVRYWNRELGVGIEYIVGKCTRENPDDRYQSCAELMYALEHPYMDDIRYRKRQASRLRGFVIPASFAVILGCASAAFWGAEVTATANTYEAYVAAAKISATKEEEIENYEKAVNLDPSAGEAYFGLLEDVFLDDGVFTAEESETLRRILISYGNGSETNEEIFRQNGEEYDEFAYRAGLAYYYYYEDGSNKKSAKGYFETAVESEYLEEYKVERAGILYTVSGYYSKIGLVDEAGDAYVSYGEYWEDLTALAQGNLVEKDNERTALVVYNETAAQIISRAEDFKNAGVAREEMEAALKNIEEHIDNDFDDSNGNYKEEMEKLAEQVRQAYLIVESVYGRSGE